MKKAFLVTYTIATRVVIDTGNHGHADDAMAAHLAAKEQLKADTNDLFENRFILDNADIEEDTEVPYEEEFDNLLNQ